MAPFPGEILGGVPPTVNLRAAIPPAAVAALLAAGITRLTVDIDLTAAPTPGEWLSIADAARTLVREDMRPAIDDDDDVRTLFDTARKRIGRAIAAGELVVHGAGRKRLISPESFHAWRNAFRNAERERCDRSGL